jgi:hypothetical protein
MSPQLARSKTVSLAVAVVAGAVLGALLLCTPPTAVAQAQTVSTITPVLFPDRLGAKGALTLTIDFTGGEFGVPAPLRKSVMKLPAGVGLDIPALRSCSAGRLRARGPGGCPRQSKIGSGHALVEARAGSQLITERITLWVFLGPLQNFQPTFEVLGEGTTPRQERVVLGGVVVPGSAPFGEELVLSVPAIPTLPLEPDASMSTMTFTVGTRILRPPRDANTVVVPESCPAGGFPFAAEFTYADGSTGSSLAKAPCPH